MSPRYARARPTPEEIHQIVMQLVDHLDAMVAFWDIDQTCVFANNAYRDWFGKTRDQIVGYSLQELLGPLYPKNLPYIRAAYAGETQVFEREIPAPDGRIRCSLATYTPYVVDGAVRGIFVHVADVTRLKKLEEALREAKERAEALATHDFLTGLPNRVLLVDRIEEAIARGKRNQRMAAVLMLDMDAFKQVNDTYGHAEGDRLLIEIAASLKGALRESDTLTRLGGDEFLLLASEMESKTQAEALAARVLQSVRRPFHLTGGIIRPTFSVGIAMYPTHGTTPQSLLANSDHALYAAKRLGKNRFAFAEDEGPA
jgi:diguanylate cyclase (GGDEF)-like protein/PAS domain S-box-containing protein